MRVRGTGFYALTPEAKAPFRIKQFLQQTRVIIPLHVKGAPQSGEVTIRPLIAGPLKVSAAIIGYTQCGENTDPAPIALNVTVEPGAPEIVIADRFDLAKPDQILASPDSKRRIEIYGPRYHLIDAATGALLADEVGKEPRFSPMGRFVIANVEKHFSIRDSIDGRVTRQQVADWDSLIDLAWDDRDSFLIALIHQDEGIEKGYIWNPLEEEDATAIHCCGGNFSDMSFRIDLENDIAVFDNGHGWKGASSLTIHTMDEKNASNLTNRSVELSGPLFAELVVPFTAPERWDMIDGLKITHFVTNYDEDKKFAAAVKRFVVRPIIVTRGDAQGLHVNNDPLRVASRGLGKVNLPEAELALRREQRLRDFGVEINPGAPLLALDQSAALKKIEGAPENTEIGEIKPLATGQAEGFRLTLFASEGGGDAYTYQYAHLYDSRRPGHLLNLSGIDPDTGPLRSICFGEFKCGFVAELFFNRYLVIWPQGENSLVIYDVEERTLISALRGMPSPDVIQRVSISKDLKTVVKLDKDGGFQVIALRPAQKDAKGQLTQDSTKVDALLSGRIVDDEVVVWTPSGQFDSTLEGASHVAVRFPGRSGEYTLDQFHKTLSQE